MLPGTIRDNISRFDPAMKDEAVIEAARTAGVHDMILRLPEGYATRIGPDRMPLSGGQIQRLGLARALYGTPRIIVLDEPNSNLDVAGDEALAQAITTMRQKGSVVIVMAHRPSAIAAVNKVMILHQGQVAQFGPKEEIMQPQARGPAMTTTQDMRQTARPDARQAVRTTTSTAPELTTLASQRVAEKLAGLAPVAQLSPVPPAAGDRQPQRPAVPS